MRTESTSGRRQWRTIVIVAVALVVGLLAGLVVVGVLRDDDPTAGVGEPATTVSASPTVPSSTSAQPSATPSQDGDPISGAQADGCLGGTDPHDAVLAAQNIATLDDLGAAGFARAIARWTATYPADPNAPAVVEAIADPGSSYGTYAASDMAESTKNLAGAGYTSGRIVPNKGGYRIIAGVTGSYKQGIGDGATLQVQVYRELTDSKGQVTETKLTATVVLSIVDSSWYMYGTLPDGSPIGADDTSIPWQSYSGAC